MLDFTYEEGIYQQDFLQPTQKLFFPEATKLFDVMRIMFLSLSVISQEGLYIYFFILLICCLCKTVL